LATFRVFHRRFEAYHHPDDRKGVMMPTRDGAATWDDRAEAKAVGAQLNERDRQPEYGELGHDDWWSSRTRAATAFGSGAALRQGPACRLVWCSVSYTNHSSIAVNSRVFSARS
jgi:hypothetical protein